MNFLLHKLNGAVKRIIIFFYPLSFPQKTESNSSDPERMALYKYCRGLGIDVGCGSKKTHPDALGVDIVAKGETGRYGSQKRQISAADITTSGDDLYMFADGVLDYVVARHNLEHYVDPVKTLKEWKRVLKKGGVLGVVLPDDEKFDSIKADPTHKHAFTRVSYKNLLLQIGGFKILELKECVPGLSFYCVSRKIK